MPPQPPVGHVVRGNASVHGLIMEGLVNMEGLVCGAELVQVPVATRQRERLLYRPGRKHAVRDDLRQRCQTPASGTGLPEKVETTSLRVDILDVQSIPRQAHVPPKAISV